MRKQVHQFSLHEVISGKVTKQAETLSSPIDEELLNQIKKFLMIKNNLLGSDIC